MRFIMYQIIDKSYLGIIQKAHVIDLNMLSITYNKSASSASSDIILTDTLSLINQGDKALSYVRTLLDWLETNNEVRAAVSRNYMRLPFLLLSQTRAKSFVSEIIIWITVASRMLNLPKNL
jgi:hypothetical protein